MAETFETFNPDGSTYEFPINFPVDPDLSVVKIYEDGVEITEGFETDLNHSRVIFTVAPTCTKLKLKRYTSMAAKAVEFTNASMMKQATHNKAISQIFYRQQEDASSVENMEETVEGVVEATAGINEAKAEAEMAAQLAAEAAKAAEQSANESDVPTHDANEDAHSAAFTKFMKDALPCICQGRLTLTSGDPRPEADVSDTQTIYFCPDHGNKLMMYDGEKWTSRTFAQISLDISALAASTNFDVFTYWDSGTAAVKLESVAWTDDVTRAIDLTTQNGIKVKSGDATHLYIGTIRTTSTAGYTSDSINQRFVWNMYNRVSKKGQSYNTSETWTYAVNAWRELNGGVNQVRFECVTGENALIRTENNLLSAFSSSTSYGHTSVKFDNLMVSYRRVSYYAVCDHGEGNVTAQAGYHYVTGCENARMTTAYLATFGLSQYSMISITGDF